MRAKTPTGMRYQHQGAEAWAGCCCSLVRAPQPNLIQLSPRLEQAGYEYQSNDRAASGRCCLPTGGSGMREGLRDGDGAEPQNRVHEMERLSWPGAAGEQAQSASQGQGQTQEHESAHPGANSTRGAGQQQPHSRLRGNQHEAEETRLGEPAM